MTPLEGHIHYNSAVRDKLHNDAVGSVEGCMEVCSEDACNGRSTYQMGLRFHNTYHAHHLDQHRGTGVATRYSPLFNYQEVVKYLPKYHQYVLTVESSPAEKATSFGMLIASLVFGLLTKMFA